MNKKFKTYSGQALAIIMIVLVVSSIIGFSVFNRSLRDKKSTIQERDSGEAYEVVDILLDTMLQYSSEDWMGKITLDTPYETNGTNDLQTLLDTFGSTFDANSLSMCKIQDSNNKYTLKLAYGNEDTMYQVEPGQAFTFLVPAGQEPGLSCEITVNFITSNLPDNTGFMLNKIFRTPDYTSEQIADYNYTDADTFCLSTCSNFTKNPSVPTAPSPFTIPMPSGIDRAQIIAINNPIQFQFTPSAGCGDLFKTLVLRASATCNGVYRAKEIIVPVHRAHYSIFNYVLFNGNGPMNSNN